MTLDPRLAAFSAFKKPTDEKPSSPVQSAEEVAADSLMDENTPPESDAEGHQFTGPGAKLIAITKKLTSLIKEETIHLRNHKPQHAASLHGEKTRLMAEYRKTLHHIQVNEHLLGEKGSPIRQFIRTITDAFRDALKEHARIVIRMKAISEGIIKAIGEEVNKKSKPILRYGSNAAMASPKVQQATSLSLNQVI